MKKLTIEVVSKSDNTRKKSDIDELNGSNAFQKRVKSMVGKLRHPVGTVLDATEKFAGAKGVSIAGAGMLVAKEAANQISRSIDFAISGIGMMCGDSALQETVEREQEKLSEKVEAVKGIAGGIASGATIGAAFGPIGAIAGGIGGAIYGGLTAEASRQRKYEERRREYEFTAWKFDSARTISARRSGVILTSGRLHQY